MSDPAQPPAAPSIRRSTAKGSGMLRRLYDWMMAYAGHRRSLSVLAAISFIESSIFPIPPDVLLIPMVLARPERALFIAGACTAASVAGGFVGYAIGFFLYETVGRWVVDFYQLGGQFQVFQESFDRYGWWIIVIKGMTPIPYKLITIAAGVFKFPLLAFTVASLISRSIRFFLLAALLWKFGPPIRAFIEQRLTWVTTAVAAAVIAGFLALRWL
jgi:membrane protein YqaA with SNARE-associated domain